MFVDKAAYVFLSSWVFGSMGLAGACPFRDLPDSKRILASCGSQAGLPAFTLVGEEGGRAASLCTREGRTKDLGADRGKWKTRNATLGT